MNVDKFTKQIYTQIESLCGLGNNSKEISQDILPLALTNLGIVSEELKVTVEELQRQNEDLVATRAELELQLRRYRKLFDYAVDGYIITDSSGKMEEANHAAATLFNVPHRFLVGKPLILFVVENERQALYSKLMQLQHEQALELTVNLCPRDSEPLKVILTLALVPDNESKKTRVQVCIRKITASKEKADIEEQLEENVISNSDRRKYVYLKGELIPLKPQVIWQVCQGLVKLTTLNEAGEEVVVGLAGAGMPFGIDLTSLHTYQATALSQVQLLCYSFSELAASPLLAATVLPQLNQRLRQTEALLAIFGQRRVKDRFEQLLQLLKQQIGQPTDQGIRLSVRFTHQELAEACATTRVTITRLLGQLQEEGKIAFDAKNHIILKEQNLFDKLPAPDLYRI